MSLRYGLSASGGQSTRTAFTGFGLRASCPKQGSTKTICTSFLSKKYLGADTHTIHLNGVKYDVKIAKSTAKLDTREMKYYLDRVQQFADTELGIILPDPEDLQWEEFYNYYKNYI
ncbi:MAG: hypothetical protein LBJ63_07725 [Prevotellaceae bacterium]|jgi:hypothetical protein|nr:hypothetical protein [Prevotellaceae bacterium]